MIGPRRHEYSKFKDFEKKQQRKKAFKTKTVYTFAI